LKAIPCSRLVLSNEGADSLRCTEHDLVLLKIIRLEFNL